jgi:hypothetical protein
MQKSYGAVVTVPLSRRCAQTNATALSSSQFSVTAIALSPLQKGSYVWVRVLR